MNAPRVHDQARRATAEKRRAALLEALKSGTKDAATLSAITGGNINTLRADLVDLVEAKLVESERVALSGNGKGGPTTQVLFSLGSGGARKKARIRGSFSEPVRPRVSAWTPPVIKHDPLLAALFGPKQQR